MLADVAVLTMVSPLNGAVRKDGGTCQDKDDHKRGRMSCSSSKRRQAQGVAGTARLQFLHRLLPELCLPITLAGFGRMNRSAV